MTTRRVTTTRYPLRALVVGFLAAAGIACGAIPSAVAAPVSGARLSSAATTSTVVACNSVVLTIRMQNASTGAAIVGVTVKLIARTDPNHPFGLAATATTNASGVASATVKPLRNMQYEWTFAGNGTYPATTSAIITILVAQALTITAARPSASTLSIYGTVAPNETGQAVGLQRQVNGVWRPFAAAVTIKSQRMPNGAITVGYRFNLNGIGPGTYVVRTSRAATSINAAGTSKTLNLTLR